MSEKVEFHNMTFKEAGHKLAELAQMTATFSQNWENFSDIAASIIEQAYKAGQEHSAGQKEGMRV